MNAASFYMLRSAPCKIRATYVGDSLWPCVRAFMIMFSSAAQRIQARELTSLSRIVAISIVKAFCWVSPPFSVQILLQTTRVSVTVVLGHRIWDFSKCKSLGGSDVSPGNSCNKFAHNTRTASNWPESPNPGFPPQCSDDTLR